MVSIWTILGWIFYGLIRYVLYLIPLVKAPRVDRGPPSAWWRYAGWWEWSQGTADGGYPNESWARAWLGMAFGELQRVATDKAKPYVDKAKAFLLGVVGYIRTGFDSMGSWVNWLQSAVGYVLPSFASNLGAAAIWLYGRFPWVIRTGRESWDQLWERIREQVRSWARSRYDLAKSWASSAINWVNGVGDQLRRWRDQVAGWLDQIRYNSYGWIVGVLGSVWAWLVGFRWNARSIVLGWLGSDWPRLVTFARDCLSFYYNLWSRGWVTLGELVNDPKAFLFDRLERAVMERW